MNKCSHCQAIATDPAGVSLRFIQSILLAASLTLFLQPTGHAAEAAAAQSSVPTKTFDENLIQANVLLKQGKLDEALAAARSAQTLDPKRFEAPAAVALILHVATPKKAEVRDAFLDAFDLWPTNRNENLERIVKLLDPETTAFDKTTADTDEQEKLIAAARLRLDPLTLITDEAIKLSTPAKKETLQASASATGKGATDSKKDLVLLQGVWGGYLAGFSHYHGKEAVYQPIPTLRRTHRINGNKWIELGADGKATSVEKTITLVVTNVPKQMQLASTRAGERGKSGEQVTEEMLYVLEGDSLTLHQALDDETKPAPKRLLERGHPVAGLDGRVWYFRRLKDE